MDIRTTQTMIWDMFEMYYFSVVLN